MIVRLLALLLLLIAAPAAAQNFPPLSGRVVDQAGLLSPADEAELNAKLEAVQNATSRQLEQRLEVLQIVVEKLELEAIGKAVHGPWLRIWLIAAQHQTPNLFLPIGEAVGIAQRRPALQHPCGFYCTDGGQFGLAAAGIARVSPASGGRM